MGTETTFRVRISPEASDWLDTVHDGETIVIERFFGAMLDELAANHGKGNRPGWLRMSRKEALAEVHWHLCKFAVAAKEFEDGRDRTALVCEYGADVANCALMMLDVMALLAPDVPVNGETE